MEQLTPKFDQVKKRYMQRKGGSASTAPTVDPLTLDAMLADLDASIANVPAKANVESKEKAKVPNGDSKALSKIAALLRRTAPDTRIESSPAKGENMTGMTEPAQECGPGKRLQETVTAMYRAKETAAAGGKGIGSAKIKRNIELSLITGDTYELLGWFQERAKLVGQLYNLSNGPDSPARRRCSVDSPAETTEPQGPQQWEDLLLYLDTVKSEVRKMGAGQDSTTTANEGMLTALHELAMLMIADKAAERGEYIQRLHTTIAEQTEHLERADERMVELREKVREYGRENADLEAHCEALKMDVRDALSQRCEAEDRAQFLELRCQQLQQEAALRTAELLQLRAAANPTDRHGSSLRAFERRLDHHSRTRGLLSDSSEDGSDVEVERKVKAAAGGTPQMTGSSTKKERRHSNSDNRDAIDSLQATQNAFRKLDNISQADWVHMFRLPHNATAEDIRTRETALNGAEADLESVLAKFRGAQRQLKAEFSARTAQLQKEEREKLERERSMQSENALCCICKEEAKSILLLPCRHLCVCQVCSQGPPSPRQHSSPRTEARRTERRIRSCPVCRAAVEECLKVYA